MGHTRTDRDTLGQTGTQSDTIGPSLFYLAELQGVQRGLGGVHVKEGEGYYALQNIYFSRCTQFLSLTGTASVHYSVLYSTAFSTPTFYTLLFCTLRVVNRPGVAGAVLQSPPLLINSFINSLTDVLWKYLHWLLIGPEIT